MRNRNTTANQRLIYHYCSPHAFQAICERTTIRFSSILAMNDPHEFIWGLTFLVDAYEQWLKNRRSDLSARFAKEVRDLMRDSHSTSLRVLLTCFSLEKDSLSQWRAYSEDALGFALGFDLRSLSKSCEGHAISVCYEHKRPITEITQWINGAFPVYQAFQKSGNDSQFRKELADLFIDLLGYKSIAFKEEKEVRIAVLADVKKSGLSLPGGTPIQFRMHKGMPVPFADLQWSPQSLRHVVIGPKNRSEPSDVRLFLNTIGLGHVRVTSSIASYQ